MLQVVHDRANALGGLPHMKMVQVGMTGDGARDLAHMKAEVCVLAGYEPIMALHCHALGERHRFLSDGDAMLLDRRAG